MFRTYIFCLFLLQLVISCKDQKATSEIIEQSETPLENQIIEVSKEQFANNGMRIDTLKQLSFPTTIKTTGVIDVPPSNKAVISAVMGGYIKTTTLLVGDQVKKGERLISLENPEFIKLQQEYLEVKQQLNYLNAEFKREEILNKERISSEKNFLKAESDLKTAEATYAGLRRQLELLNINPLEVEAGNITSIVHLVSPIKGSITKISVSLGTYVSPTTPIMEVVDNDHIHLELSVFEKDIMKIEKGQEIVYEIPEASEKVFKAEVYLIGKALEENRTIKVHAHLSDSEVNRFLPGMFVDAYITTAIKEQLAVQEESIIDIDGQKFMLILNDKNEESYFFKPSKIISQGSTKEYLAIMPEDEISKGTLFLSKGAFELFGE